MHKTSKTQKNSRKRTQFMCAAMLRWIRVQMGFEPRDMRATLALPGCKPIPRRTYQDYEAGKRGIPAKLATRIREVFKCDREFMATICHRVDIALTKQFPGGVIPSYQAKNEDDE